MKTAGKVLPEKAFAAENRSGGTHKTKFGAPQDAPFIFRSWIYKANEGMMSWPVACVVVLANMCVIAAVVLSIIGGRASHWSTDVPQGGSGDELSLQNVLCNSTMSLNETLAELQNLTALAAYVRNFDNTTCIGNINVGFVGNTLGRLIINLFGAFFYFSVYSLVNQKASTQPEPADPQPGTQTEPANQKADTTCCTCCFGSDDSDLSEFMRPRVKERSGAPPNPERLSPRIRCATLATYLMMDHKNTAESERVGSEPATRASCFHLPVYPVESMGNKDYDWLNPVADLADDFDSSDKFHPGVYAADACNICGMGCPKSPFFWMILIINLIQIGWLGFRLCYGRAQNASDDAFQHFWSAAENLNLVLTLFAATVGFSTAGAEFRLLSRYFARFLHAIDSFASDKWADADASGGGDAGAEQPEDIDAYVSEASRKCWDSPRDVKRDYDLLRKIYKTASREWRLLTALCFVFSAIWFGISCVMLIKDGLKASWAFAVVGSMGVFFSAAALQLYVNVPFDTLKEKLSVKVAWLEEEEDKKPFDKAAFLNLVGKTQEEETEGKILDTEAMQAAKGEAGKEQEEAKPHLRLRVIEFDLQNGKVPMRNYFYTYPVRFELYGFVLTAKWFVGLVTSSSVTTFCTFFISIYTTASSN